MARRRSRSSRSPSPFGKLVLAMVFLIVGAVGGYAWRSYAPLPLPTPLGGDDAYADVKPLANNTTPTPRPSTGSSDESAEIARLRAEIDRLRQAQSQTAQDIAEIQIKSVLGEE